MKIKVQSVSGAAVSVPVATKEKIAYRNICEAFKIGFSMGAKHADRTIRRSVNG
mgnify:CR=1 FL=1